MDSDKTVATGTELRPLFPRLVSPEPEVLGVADIPTSTVPASVFAEAEPPRGQIPWFAWLALGVFVGYMVCKHLPAAIGGEEPGEGEE